MSYIGIGYELEHYDFVCKVLNHFTGKNFYITNSDINFDNQAVFFKNDNGDYDEYIDEEITSIEIVKTENNDVILKLNNHGFSVDLDFDKFYTKFKNDRYVSDTNITNNQIFIDCNPYPLIQQDTNSICSLLTIQYDLSLVAPFDEGEVNFYINKDLASIDRRYSNVHYSMGNSMSIPTIEDINELKEHIKDIPFLTEEEIKIITISYTGR